MSFALSEFRIRQYLTLCADEDASNPHGGTDGSKELADETLILIDVGYANPSDVYIILNHAKLTV